MPKFSGALDLHYTYNFNNPAPVTAPSDASPTPPAGNNRYRVFDIYHEDIALSLAELTVQKEVGNLKFFVALDFGHTPEIMSPHDQVSRNVGQAYLTYQTKAHPEFSLSAGKMLTHMGWEVAKTKENWNYSRSFLFGYAIPFWHVGVAGHYDPLPELKTALFLYNENSGLYETNRGKSVGAQIRYVPFNDGEFIYNFLSGTESGEAGATHLRTLHEWIATLRTGPAWQWAADFVFGQLSGARSDGRTAQWAAWSAAAKWTHGFLSLSPRYEIFTDRSGASVDVATADKPALPQILQSATLTLGADCGDGLELRLEARQDHSSASAFTSGSSGTSSSQTTLGLGLLYDF